jgi:hypothetical protein
VVSEHGGELLEEPVLTVDLHFQAKRPGGRSGKSKKARKAPPSR